MICPHCHNKIPNGSNICPLCFSNVAGVAGDDEVGGAVAPASTGTASKKKKSSSSSRSKSRKSRKGGRAPLIVAIGLILLLLVIIVLIVRSMFTGTALPGGSSPEVTVRPRTTVEENMTVFGVVVTSTPDATEVPTVEITPTPEPTEEPVQRTYTTLKRGDQSPDVALLQRALAQLGFLNSAADGIYGTGTMTAVKNFQSANGLDVDGIAGSKTQELLFSLVTLDPIVESTVAPGEILDLPG